MTIKELEAALDNVDYQNILDGETEEEYIQRSLTSLPKVEYAALPDSLKKDVRATFTPTALKEFLEKCYAEKLKSYKELPQEDIDRFENVLGAKLDNVLSFEWQAANIPPQDLDKILVKARNSATYVIRRGTNDRYILDLYSYYAIDAFENTVFQYWKDKTDKQSRKGMQYKTRAKAAELSSLVSVGAYQSVISDPAYSHALTTQKNDTAYIALVAPDFFKDLEFNAESGELSLQGEAKAKLKQYKRGQYEDIKEIDLPLLQQLYTATLKSYSRMDSKTVTVHTPTFLREMGIDTQRANSADIMKKLNSFDSCMGIMPQQGTVSKVFTLIEMDLQHNTMTFAAPYMLRVIGSMAQEAQRTKKTRSGETIAYMIPQHNTLVHSTIAKEKNKPAVELVYIITNKLLQRGTVPDTQTYKKRGRKSKNPDKISYSISFAGLLNEASLLRSRINSYETELQGIADPEERKAKARSVQTHQNTALNRAFSKAFELLFSHTDAQAYFVDLSITKIIPTMKTLDLEFEASFSGINADYKRKNP